MSFISRFNLFPKISVGLDVADRSLEVAELVRRGGLLGAGGQIKVMALGREALPAGVVERGVIKNETRLAQAVKNALTLAKPSPIAARRLYLGLPESQVYLHSLTRPRNELSRRVSDWRDFILREARENVPLEADDLFVTYQALGERPEGVNIILVAVSRRLLASWQNFFRRLGLTVEFDLETNALFRSIAPLQAGPIVVADFGAVATQVAVFECGGLRYSRTLPYGAEMLTENLMKTLKLTAAGAEEQKQEVGLIDPDSKVFTILLKGLVPLRDELKVTFDYYEKWVGRKVSALFLAGGGSQLRGLADYLQSNLEVPTSVAHSAFLNQPLVYLEAIGLALKGFARPAALGAGLAFRFEPEEKVSPWIKNRRLAALFGFALIGALIIAGAYEYRQKAKQAERDRLRPQLESIPIVSPEVALPFGVASTTSATSTLETITVAETPTGWLNVRSGPSGAAAVITKVYPGENYPLLAKDGEWYKIEAGWVNKKYIINNSE